MHSAVSSDHRLSNSWHVFAFAYGNASTLLVCDHGHVAGSISSERGGETGLRAGLPRLCDGDAACLRGLRCRSRCVGGGHHGRLHSDWPARCSVSSVCRFVDLVRPLGIEVNTAKTKIQQAAGESAAQTLQAAAQRGLEIVYGNHKCLGGLVGVDDQAAVAWLEAKLTMQTPVQDHPKMDASLPLPTHLL